MRKQCILVLTLILFNSCRINNKLTTSDENYCFYMKKEYIFLKIKNDKKEEVHFPSIENLVDKDLTLIPRYFKMSSDTILIRSPNVNDISISHKTENTVVKITTPIITIKNGDSIEQVFKTKKKFNVVILDDTFVFNKCK